MPQIRILIADDSALVRRIVTDVLQSDPALVVADTAPNGRIALRKIAALRPDAVILDVEMPEMDGLETLKAIRRTNTRLPVIMFSSLTERGASITLDALAAGASDYVAKPTGVRNLEAAQEHIRTQLIPKIKAFCAVPSRPPAAAAPPRRAPAPRTQASRTQARPHTPRPRRVDIVAVGVSTGGPNALADLMPTFPSDFPVPIVIVQHMPPVFTKSLAKRLSGVSALDVQEAAEGDVLQPGTAWIAPGNYHMALAREQDRVRITLNQDSPENSCRPAVDVLFRSVAGIYGSHALAVILTGMGSDGLAGCKHLADCGSQVIVQDEDSSVVWGMPGVVARAGLAESVLPLNQVGAEIIRRTQFERTTHRVRHNAPF